MRRRGTRIALCALLLCVLRGAAGAVPFANDAVPAATLLLPYFEVDLEDANGPATVFRIANAAKDPHLAHVTLWTDLGIPTFAFDVYLAGHDLAEIDLRLVFTGILPRTAPTLNAPGTHANPAVAFPGCDAMASQGRLTEDDVAALRAAHTGGASSFWGGMCGGRPLGDDIARGYVTVDVVNRCSSKFPGDPASGNDPAYFAALGTGIASDANALWGEYWFLERTQQLGYADRLVHVEATTPPFPQNLTFYGRRVGGSTMDDREPLEDTYFGRFVNGGTFDGGTHALVWRDPGVVLPFVCGATLPKIQQREVTPFDEQENPVDLTDGFPIGFQTRFPWAAERVDLADPARIPIPQIFGFLFLDLNFPPSVTDPLFSGRNQAHVTMVYRANGRFAGANTAWQSDVATTIYPVP